MARRRRLVGLRVLGLGVKGLGARFRFECRVKESFCCCCFVALCSFDFCCYGPDFLVLGFRALGFWDSVAVFVLQSHVATA